MNLLKHFRNPYYSIVTVVVLFLSSCTVREPSESNKVKNFNFNFKDFKRNIQLISTQINNKNIHNFESYKESFSKSFKSNNGISDDEFNQVKSFLIQTGWAEGSNLNADRLFEYAINDLYSKQIISTKTRDFLILNFNSSNPQLTNANVQNFINSNVLTNFEKDFLLNLQTELIRIDGCDIFGGVLGVVIGVVATSSGAGAWVAGFAGMFVSLAAADVCRGIAAQL